MFSIFRRYIRRAVQNTTTPRVATRIRPSLDRLEARDVPAAAIWLDAGVLHIDGTNSPETLTIDQFIPTIGNDRTGDFSQGVISSNFLIRATITNSSNQVVLTQDFNPNQITSIQVEAFGGNDVVRNNTAFPMYALGGTGRDVLVGGTGADSLYGEEGRDAVYGGRGDDYVSGGDDTDFVHGGRGIDLVRGNRGDDVLVGGGGSDTLYGEDGHDSLFGGRQGTEDLEDWAAYWVYDLPDLDSTLLAADTSSDGNDILYGGAGSDFLFGQFGNDELHGGDGFDHLVGGSGHDTLAGGTGTDELDSELQPVTGPGIIVFYLTELEDDSDDTYIYDTFDMVRNLIGPSLFALSPGAANVLNGPYAGCKSLTF